MINTSLSTAEFENRLFSFLDVVEYDEERLLFGPIFHSPKQNIKGLLSLSLHNDPIRKIEEYSNMVHSIIYNKQNTLSNLRIKYNKICEDEDGNVFQVPCSRRVSEEESKLLWRNIEAEMWSYVDALEKHRHYFYIKQGEHVAAPRLPSTAGNKIAPAVASGTTKSKPAGNEPLSFGCKLPNDALKRLYMLQIRGRFFVHRSMSFQDLINSIRDTTTDLRFGCFTPEAILILERLQKWFTNFGMDEIAASKRVRTKKGDILASGNIDTAQSRAHKLRKNKNITYDLDLFFNEIDVHYKGFV